MCRVGVISLEENLGKRAGYPFDKCCITDTFYGMKDDYVGK